jgi:hypothetical protein
MQELRNSPAMGETNGEKSNGKATEKSAPPFVTQPYDRENPNTWDVLYLDQAIPVDPIAKAYMIRDLQSWTRSYLLIPIKLIANILLAAIMTVKRLLPWQFNAYGLMHQSAAWFLNTFVSPEACYLIVRHICIGSNIVNFLIDNGPDRAIEKSTLYPRTVDDLANNAFLEHDLVLYNFVWDYHQAERVNPHWVEEVKQRGLNYDSVKPIEVEIDFAKRRWLRILDLESAIELFKVFYSLCLTSDEFARAVLSLQFDENFGLYFTKITGDSSWNHVITNRHPLAPNSPFQAARDLMLHGIISEYLYRYLEIRKEMEG